MKAVEGEREKLTKAEDRRTMSADKGPSESHSKSSSSGLRGGLIVLEGLLLLLEADIASSS